MNTNQELKPLYEIAKSYGLNNDYLRVLIMRKKLKAVKEGRAWVTSGEWVEEYLKHAELWKEHLRTNGVPGARKKGEKTVFISKPNQELAENILVHETAATPEVFDLEFLGIELQEPALAASFPGSSLEKPSVIEVTKELSYIPFAGRRNAIIGVVSLAVLFTITIGLIKQPKFLSGIHFVNVKNLFAASVAGMYPSEEAKDIIVDSFNTGGVIESYTTSDSSIKKGDLVGFNEIDGVYGKAVNNQEVLGSALGEPELVLRGISSDSYKKEFSIPIVTEGIAEVNVAIENGSIETGDCLTASKEPGIAVKSLYSGEYTVGVALEPTSANGLIKAYIKSGYSNYLNLNNNFCRIKSK